MLSLWHAGGTSKIHAVEVDIPVQGKVVLVRLQEDGGTWLAMKHLHKLLDMIIKPGACSRSAFHNLVLAKGTISSLNHCLNMCWAYRKPEAFHASGVVLQPIWMLLHGTVPAHTGCCSGPYNTRHLCWI